MHLTAFRAGKGDCLLLTNAADTARILVDGGMPAPHAAHVAPELAKLRTHAGARKNRIDLVYVSHIDEDHIGGVLKLLDTEVAWRVHDYQRKHHNPSHKAPVVARPPVIKRIWHNAFHEQMMKNAGEIEDALAATAPVLSAAAIEEMREEGRRQAGFVTSIRQAIQVSRRIGPNQLGIPLNAQAKGRLMMVRKGQRPIVLGGMTLTVIGPTGRQLKELRTKWNTWLQHNKATLATIRAKARADEDRLGTADFDRLLLSLRLHAEAFGRPESVTPENLASLMLLVEEGDHSILLTGDARWDQFVEGLEETGRLAKGHPLTVDILKVPHHGSKNNIKDTALLDRITARDYVFSGNGEHHNPHPEVVEVMFRHRMKAAGKFKFWFNTSEALEDADGNAETAGHMRDLEKLTRQLANSSQGRMTFRFLTAGSTMRVA
jgi:beta-lactamase superfamily II metal-dependent hydrolase